MSKKVIKILMLVENHYPQDTRVRNEATLLASSGYQVSVICLRKGSQPRTESVDGVRVYRLPRLELFKKTPSGNSSLAAALVLKLKSFLGYVFEYCYFTSACFAVSCYVWVRHGFDVIHAHNPRTHSSWSRSLSSCWERNLCSTTTTSAPNSTAPATERPRVSLPNSWASLNGAA